MRWENASSSANNEVYHLWNKDKKLLTLTFHPFSSSARVESEDEKRVFLLRKEGFFRNRTVLRNEYGIKIGELGTENDSRYIDVNGERFYYHVQNNPLAELVLYKESKDQPLITCGLNVQNGNTSVQFEKTPGSFAHTGLLMALCWYMFMPVVKENVPAFAS